MRLRHQRHALTQALHELRVRIDLLRHKALALRAVSQTVGATAPYALSPGSMSPEALAEALAEQSPPRQRRRNLPGQRTGADGTAELLRRAMVLWNVVGDPEDPLACQDLAAAADRLADRLEERWRATREDWRSVGEELAQSLASAHAHIPRGPAPD